AHPEVFNILLQVMDHGTLTDNNGRKTDFRNVILIMTTNAGAEQMSRASIGFTHQDHSSDGAEALKKIFTPEFRNRIDSIVQFAPLSRDAILHVVDKFLAELQGQLDETRVLLNASEDARRWLAERGYDESMGARPMARLVQDKIKNRWPKRFCAASSVRAGKWIFLRKRASWCWRCPKKYRPEVGTHPGRLASACPVSNPAFAQVVGG